MAKYKLLITFICTALLWFAIWFIGYFFASNIWFLVAMVGISVATYYALQKMSKKVSLIISFTTAVIAAGTIITGFEEDYCWAKGTEADPLWLKMVTATTEDVKALEGFSVKEGEQIGVSFRAHMTCHPNFDLRNAIKEKYFL